MTLTKDDTEYQRNAMLKHRYGITAAQYDAMFAAQDGRCKLCERHHTAFKHRLHVDHDHKTGAVRGLLCASCNMRLAWAESVGLATIEGYLGEVWT